MAVIPFLGPTYNGRSVNIDASRCVNFFPELNPQDSKTPMALVGTRGSRIAFTLPTNPVRALYPFNGLLYAISGGGLYSVTSGLIPSTVLGTLTTGSGKVSIANNGIASSGAGGNQIMIVDGAHGYIYNVVTGVFTTITSVGFPSNPTYVAYLDGYFIVTDGSMNHWVSDLYNGLVWNPLATSPVAAASDNIKAIIALHQQLWFIKEYNTEIWYDNGTPTSQGTPFLRVSGAVIDYGTLAPFSVAKGDNSVFWLAWQRHGDTGILVGVVELNGYVPTIVSPPAINYRLSQLTTLSDAFGFCWYTEGHSFYVLTFPTEDITLVYDASTQMWHEWSTMIPTGTANFGIDADISVPYGLSAATPLSLLPYDVHRHLSDCYAYFIGRHFVGDYRSKQVYELRNDYYKDDTLPIASFRTAQHLWDPTEIKNVIIHKLQLDFEAGVGDDHQELLPYAGELADGSITADGTYYAGVSLQYTGTGNPRAFLSWSNDGGHTWSSDYYARIGRTSEYKTRAIWRRLGYARDRVFRVAIQDAVKRHLIHAAAEITA